MHDDVRENHVTVKRSKYTTIYNIYTIDKIRSRL